MGDIMKDYNVGDLVSEFLHQIDVKDVFGVVSVHNIPMLDAIGRRNHIRMIPESWKHHINNHQNHTKLIHKCQPKSQMVNLPDGKFNDEMKNKIFKKLGRGQARHEQHSGIKKRLGDTCKLHG